ncbi:Kelch domain-containing protein 10 [Toxocara canis]|uniref:Kelch domain-containing protein 10 n=1 Tax=Toxocara canis TaxID=6265 RepID=A0A0B2URI4_TOXCA|nr:Kelch domain-containing protein 10 [Toxocara canis]
MEILDVSDTASHDDEPFPIPASGCTISALGSNLVVVGGWNPHHEDMLIGSHDRGYVRKVYKYNLYTGLWTEHLCYSDQQNCPIETACHCAFPFTSTKLLVLGGSLSSFGIDDSSNRVYFYSIDTESWREINCTGRIEHAPSTHIGHWWGRAGFFDGDTLTVCTGNYQTGQLEINQLHMGKQPFRWEKVTPMEGAQFAFPLIKHQIVVYDSKVFVFGGSMAFFSPAILDGFRATLASIPTFDLISKRWSYTQCAIEGDKADIWPFAPSVVLIGHCAFLTGGAIFRDDHTVDLLADVMRLDLKEKRWTTFSRLKGNGRFFHASCLGDDGRLYVYGGCLGTQYESCTRSNEVEFVQCSVATLYHSALRALFSKHFGAQIAKRFSRSKNEQNAIIAQMKMDGFPDFAIKELL